MCLINKFLDESFDMENLCNTILAQRSSNFPIRAQRGLSKESMTEHIVLME